MFYVLYEVLVVFEDVLQFLEVLQDVPLVF